MRNKITCENRQCKNDKIKLMRIKRTYPFGKKQKPRLTVRCLKCGWDIP